MLQFTLDLRYQSLTLRLIFDGLRKLGSPVCDIGTQGTQGILDMGTLGENATQLLDLTTILLFIDM